MKSALRTSFCELLGIDYPIMQAGMGPFGSDAALAAAVSNAGALGSLGGALRTAEHLRGSIRRIRELTGQSFVVNFTQPWLQGHSESFDIAVEMGAPVISMALAEAGGFGGSISTFVLVPQVVDAVTPVPVLAAGGIADGRGLAAALMPPKPRTRSRWRSGTISSLNREAAPSMWFPVPCAPPSSIGGNPTGLERYSRQPSSRKTSQRESGRAEWRSMYHSPASPQGWSAAFSRPQRSCRSSWLEPWPHYGEPGNLGCKGSHVGSTTVQL